MGDPGGGYAGGLDNHIEAGGCDKRRGIIAHIRGSGGQSLS
jgi:hypothetical protein